MRACPAAVMAIGLAVSAPYAEAQTSARTDEAPRVSGQSAQRCIESTAGVGKPLTAAAAACEPTLQAGPRSGVRDFAWMIPLGGSGSDSGFRLEGTSSFMRAARDGSAPVARPSASDEWRTQQTFSYRTGAGLELQAGVSASHGATWPFSVQQLDAPGSVPLGGFGVEPRSLDTRWHTSFSLRKALTDGHHTFTPFGEAIDLIPTRRRANDPAGKASSSPRVRVGGIFGF